MRHYGRAWHDWRTKKVDRKEEGGGDLTLRERLEAKRERRRSEKDGPLRDLGRSSRRVDG